MKPVFEQFADVARMTISDSNTVLTRRTLPVREPVQSRRGRTRKRWYRTDSGSAVQHCFSFHFVAFHSISSQPVRYEISTNKHDVRATSIERPMKGDAKGFYERIFQTSINVILWDQLSRKWKTIRRRISQWLPSTNHICCEHHTHKPITTSSDHSQRQYC